MKVYTHYYPIANSEDGFRWRTLLQFGKSWDVIGSVVMKNPGSAKFLYPDAEIGFSNVYSIDSQGKCTKHTAFDALHILSSFPEK